METTLYYTLSTISQTLAATAALLGAFVLYRLQILGAAIRECADYLVNIAANYTGIDAGELSHLNAAGEYHKFSQRIASLVTDHPTVNANRARLGRALEAANSLRGDFRDAMFVVSLVISYSLIALAAVTWLVMTPIRTWVALAAAVLGSLVSLLLCLNLIRRAMDEFTV